MTLWLIFALMTAVAIFAVLWPLGRGGIARREGSDVAVYQDQMREIAQDRASGLIGAVEAEAARVEVSRRLLVAADAAAAAASSPTDMAGARASRRRIAASLALVAFPLATGGMYFALGSPQLPDQPLAARLQAPASHQSIDLLVAQVEHRLEQNPEDGRGWQVLGPVYMRLGRFDDAVKARRNTLRLLGESAERRTDLGESLVAAANGMVTADAKDAFDRALKLDPQHVKTRFFVGLAAEQDGRREAAATIWRELLEAAPPGAPWAELVRQSLARLDGKPIPESAGPAGPSADDVAAAANLAPDQRADMVRGMVERLAERLRQDGSDLEGWLRLMRAYTVLGEREKARGAASDARRALGADPDKLRRLDELAKTLGIEG